MREVPRIFAIGLLKKALWLLGTYELELQRGRERCEPARPEHGGTRGDLARADQPAMGWPI
jgi:hypothetical protein